MEADARHAELMAEMVGHRSEVRILLQVAGDGSWTLIVPNANQLSDALYQVVATLTDAAGNATSDPGVDDLLIDTTAPAGPGVTATTSMTATPAISGTVTLANGETLSVTVNGVTYSAGDGNLVDNADGTWTLMIPVGDALDDGRYDVTATVTGSKTSLVPS